MVYQPRDYRQLVHAPDLVQFRVVVHETDLQILAEKDLTKLAEALVVGVRTSLEIYIAKHPWFAESFSPVDVDDSAPPIVLAMADAARAAGVGPMAAVAGAVAEHVATGLARFSSEVIVENGGDLYLVGARERVVGLLIGEGRDSVGLRIAPEQLPCAVATSSATIGPSISLGRADAATVVSSSGALADAAASALGNRLHVAADIEAALEAVCTIDGVDACVASVEGALGARGRLELVPFSSS